MSKISIEKNIEAIYPLSPMQQGMLFHALLAPEADVYLRQWISTCTLDVSALREAWQRVLDRHAVLRSAILWEGLDEPLQVVGRRVNLPYQLLDWRDCSPAEQQELLEAFLQEDRQRGFVLSTAPLMRLTLIRLSDEEYRCVWTYHHLLLDGWSLHLILAEVFAFYQDPQAFLPPTPPFSDYIAWLKQQDMREAERFWRSALEGVKAMPPLPIDHRREERAEAIYEDLLLELPPDEVNALTTFARRHHLTLNTVAQGALALLLSRYSGEDDVVFGTVVSGRPADLPGVESMIGLFINTLPVRVKLPPAMSVASWLQDLQLHQLEARQYEFSSLVQVQKWSGVPGDQPLFECLYVFENHPAAAFSEEQEEDWEPGDIRLIGRTSYPLTVFVQPGTRLRVQISYDRNRFDTSAITSMSGHLRVLLAALVSSPGRSLAELPLVTPAEKRQLVDEWNNTGAVFGGSLCIPDLFEAQVERTPTAIAASFEGTDLTYHELNVQANQLAHYLQRNGVGPDVLVGICMERSFAMVISILAVLKAGGAYVPLDPGYPEERLAFLLEDAQVTLLLTQQQYRSSLSTHHAKLVCLDAKQEVIGSESRQNPCRNLQPDHLAYVIYTSGSTGKPKGAMNTHRAVSNRLLWMMHTYPLTETDSVLQKTPFSFDVSVCEFLLPLLMGARLVLARPGGHSDPCYLAQLIDDEQITMVHFVPSMLDAFLKSADLARCYGLRRVICSGEALSPALKERFFALLNAELFNLYGPTETAIEVTCWPCTRETEQGEVTVPIGQPISNITIYVLDRHMQLAPVDVPGELHIGGVGLARGYLNRPGLTAEKFLPDPFSREPGARLYRSGDLARRLPDGTLEFLGRNDDQVKLRGVRIELGEIAARLTQHPAIREAAVLLREDITGEKRLVSYLILNKKQTPAVNELRRFLGKTLPEYMLPAAFVVLDAFPLTPNGKLDRKALPMPDAENSAPGSRYVAPRTPVEKSLTEIWSQALNVERVGIHDNFFEIGGDSILSIYIISKAGEAGLKLTPKQVFMHPTIAELAEIAGQQQAGSARPHNEQGVVTGNVELTPIQHWFFEQRFPDPHHWNQAFMLEARNNLDPGLLERAIGHLLVHHDALRLRFRKSAHGWRQRLQPPDEHVPFRQLDLSGLSLEEQRTAIERIASETQTSLDIYQGPLLRIVLFRTGRQMPDRLLIVIHHLAIDGVSWRILLNDLSEVYRQLSRSETAQLPLKTTSYKHWAASLKGYVDTEEIKQELDYWTGISREHIPSLPLDYPGGTNTEESAREVSVSLDPQETRALLQAVPQAYHTQINDALLTALAQALVEWMGKRPLLFALEGHGREDLIEGVDLSRTAGWFTVIYPFLLHTGRINEAGEALRSTKEQLRRVPRHGIGYGLLRYLCADPEIRKRMASLPYPQMSFNYWGQLDQSFTASSLFDVAQESVGPEHSPRGMRNHLLDFSGTILGGCLRFGCTYSERLHNRATVLNLLHSFIGHLRGLIRHCETSRHHGYTPSDFPEAQLSQEELDSFIAELG